MKLSPGLGCPSRSLLRVFPCSPPPSQRTCYLSINPQKDEALETEKVQYTLPDGSMLDVSRRAWPWVAVVLLGLEEEEACLPQSYVPKVGPARFRAPELLFQPDLVGDESEGLHEVLAFAIHKSDLDLRRTLFANIVLSGGSTLFKGALVWGVVVGFWGPRAAGPSSASRSMEPGMGPIFYWLFGAH